ncbi:MAG: hypothetical protein ABSC45_14755 [Desulfobaccales bacterium]|jgi:PHP family Zn ribbon phosphoesterase
MGLWLKCPGCQSNNPLDLKVCPKCGRSLGKLPRQERVYVIGALKTAAPEARPPAARAAAVPKAPKPASKPQKSRPKKR